MHDLAKVINCLTDIENIMIARQEICPREELQYWVELHEGVADAISLLKEQEAVEPFHRCIGKEFSLIEDSHFDYCPYCGKPITWAKQEGR